MSHKKAYKVHSDPVIQTLIIRTPVNRTKKAFCLDNED